MTGMGALVILIGVLIVAVFFVEHRARKAEEKALYEEQKNRYREWDSDRKDRNKILKDLGEQYESKKNTFIKLSSDNSSDDDSGSDGPTGNA